MCIRDRSGSVSSFFKNFDGLSSIKSLELSFSFLFILLILSCWTLSSKVSLMFCYQMLQSGFRIIWSILKLSPVRCAGLTILHRVGQWKNRIFGFSRKKFYLLCWEYRSPWISSWFYHMTSPGIFHFFVINPFENPSGIFHWYSQQGGRGCQSFFLKNPLFRRLILIAFVPCNTYL